jgi:hypothetical protein
VINALRLGWIILKVMGWQNKLISVVLSKTGSKYSRNVNTFPDLVTLCPLFYEYGILDSCLFPSLPAATVQCSVIGTALAPKA